nr:ankyrin repeat and SOCS box protein 13 [Microcebus murinus]
MLSDIQHVDARNIDGSTPLCDACASGSIECVKLLLSYGAKVNPPLYTASPLHEACMSGTLSSLGPFSSKGRCRVRGSHGHGAKLEALTNCALWGTPLHVACAREHLDCVKVLLNAGANVNAAKLHETALHHAAKVKNVDLIEMLVEFGGNIYARDNRGKKPLDYTWSSSAPAKCLEYYEKTPLTLSQLCRVSLRKATGVRGLEKIAKLNIPPRPSVQGAVRLPETDLPSSSLPPSLVAETPLTLSQLCRVSLRKATGVRGLEKIAKLNIPPRLIDYLSYN